MDNENSRDELLDSVDKYIEKEEQKKLKLEGDSFFRALDYEKALECYYKILEVLDKDTQIEVLEKMALCYEKLGDEKTALNFWKRLLALDPYNLEARKRTVPRTLKGIFHKLKRKVDEWSGNYETLLKELEDYQDEYRSRMDEYHYLRSHYLWLAGRKEEALEAIEKAYMVSPQIKYLEYLILYSIELQKMEKLREMWAEDERVKELPEDLLERYADLLVAYNEYERAIEVYRAVFLKKPSYYTLRKIMSLDFSSFWEFFIENYHHIEKFSQEYLIELVGEIFKHKDDFSYEELKLLVPLVKNDQALINLLKTAKKLTLKEREEVFSLLDFTPTEFSEEAVELIEKVLQNEKIESLLFILENYYLLKFQDQKILDKYRKLLRQIISYHPLDWDYWRKYFNLVTTRDDALEVISCFEEEERKDSLFYLKFLEAQPSLVKSFIEILKICENWKKIARVEEDLWKKGYREKWLIDCRIEVLIRNFRVKDLLDLVYSISLEEALQKKILSYLKRVNDFKVVVSACLVGFDSTYRGDTKFRSPFLLHLISEGVAVPICPEVMGGLPTPRNPSEIESGDGRGVVLGERKVINSSGEDVTKQFLKGAEEAAKMLRYVGGKVAVLKSKSPSCGIGRVYDGTFSEKLVEGDGVFVAYLKEKYPDTKLYMYHSLEDDEKLKAMLLELVLAS